MRRRTFLGSAIGLLSSRFARASTPQPEVLIIGGGPAGISAAIELTERGVPVQLFEAGSQLGGKVKGWEESIGGERVDVEHGVHGWWYQYVHFRDLLGRYALLEGLLEPRRPDTGMRLADGFRVTGFFSRASRFIRQANAQGHGFFPVQYGKGQRWIRKLSVPEIRGDYAGISVADWVAGDPPLTVFSVFDRMMCWSMYFRGPSEVEAAEYIEGERFYFSGGPHNREVSWLTGNPQTRVWKPLANAITARGGVIHRNTPVTEILVDRGRPVGVRTGRPAAQARVEGPVEEWTSIDLDGERVWIGPGELGPVALSSICTHQGCEVDRSAEGFLCPCHGGRFDGAGQPTGGPPEHPLARYPVRPDGEGFIVERPATRRSYYAPWIVLAVDVPALQQLAGELLPSVKGLAACPVVVGRFWLDQDVDNRARPAVLLDGYAHASNGFLIHRLQQSSGEWAASRGGSVIEIQAFRGWTGSESDTERLDAIEAELFQIWPELVGAKVLKRHLTVGDHFTWFKPGWRESAVPVQSGVEGLLLAGDHVDVPGAQAQFMERAVLTGRMAANIVLRATGRRAAEILGPR